MACSVDDGAGDGFGDGGIGGGDCEPAGSGSADGEVAGVNLAPIAAVWYDEKSADTSLIAIDELDARCGESGTGPGQRLILGFCAPVTARSYTIVRSSVFPDTACPQDGIAIAAVEESAEALDIAVAEAGSIVIETVEECVRGRYSAEFPGGAMIAGAFAALRCGR